MSVLKLFTVANLHLSTQSIITICHKTPWTFKPSYMCRSIGLSNIVLNYVCFSQYAVYLSYMNVVNGLSLPTSSLYELSASNCKIGSSGVQLLARDSDHFFVPHSWQKRLITKLKIFHLSHQFAGPTLLKKCHLIVIYG